MLRKRRTAVGPKRNLLGRLVRGQLSVSDVITLSKAELLDLLDMGYLLPRLAGGTTTAQNTTLANPVYFPKAIVVSTDQAINQGDLVYWDATNYTLKALSSPSQVANQFCGAAQGTSNPGVYPTPPSGASESLPGVVVQRGGTVRVNTPTGDGSYFPFEPVTVGADAQTVTRGGETSANRVGFVIVPLPVSARSGPGATPLPETSPAGSAVELWLEPKFPDTALL